MAVYKCEQCKRRITRGNVFVTSVSEGYGDNRIAYFHEQNTRGDRNKRTCAGRYAFRHKLALAADTILPFSAFERLVEQEAQAAQATVPAA